MPLNAKKLKKKFPIFKNNPGLVYLDSAATSQKPNCVVKAENDYYEKYCANVHRGLYDLSEKASMEFESAREAAAKFINARSSREIIFTRGATESLNMIALGFAEKFLKQGDEIITTLLEHHANFVPWQITAENLGCKLKFWDINADGTLNEKEFNKLLTNRTKILAITHISNALGTINPLKKIIQKAKNADLKVIVDACQSAPHLPVDVQNLDVDFWAFSGHKMLAGTGTGILYGKEKLLENMEPFLFGGNMIKEVYKTHSVWNDLPWRFEAGTPNIAGAIGLKKAIEYLQKIGMNTVREHEKRLLSYALKNLKNLPFIRLFGPCDPEIQSGIVSFNIKNVHPHDAAAVLNQSKIAVRAGHHCCMPLMNRLGVLGTARASFYLYNTEEDVEKFIEALKKVYKTFR